MAMLTVTFAQTDLEQKVLKDERYPTLGVIQQKIPGYEMPKAEAYDPEVNRISEAYAHKAAYDTYAEVNEMKSSYVQHHSTFFTQTGQFAPKSKECEGKPIAVGTDCSGIEAPIQALCNLGIKFDHLFSSEIDDVVRQTIQAIFETKGNI